MACPSRGVGSVLAVTDVPDVNICDLCQYTSIYFTYLALLLEAKASTMKPDTKGLSLSFVFAMTVHDLLVVSQGKPVSASAAEG